MLPVPDTVTSNTLYSVTLSVFQVVIIIILINSVKGRLVRFGCLSHREKLGIDKLPNETKALIQSYRPEWCDSVDSTSHRLRDAGQPQSTKPPYVIQSSNWTRSNSLRVTVRPRKKGDAVNFIQEIIIQARPIVNNSNPPQISLTESVGQFYPLPADMQLGCCELFDRNIARLYINTTSPRNSSKVNFIWVPNGFKQDYEGPIVFVATISNTISQYWTQVKSHLQMARGGSMVEKADFQELNSTEESDA